MSATLPITEARSQFGSLVRRASTRRERITITDHGQPAAVLINAQELADLEDELAIALYRAEKGAGTLRTVPHAEVRERLGPESGVTYEVIWSERAIDQAAGFLKDDPEGLEQLLDAVDLLAEDPRPEGTTEYGSPDLRRLHVSPFRVLYDIDDTTVTVVVIHAGRLG